MKIALLSWEALHSIAVGGVAVHVSELGAALQRKGHEAHIFTRMGEGQSLYENVFGVHYHRCSFDSNPHFIEEINNMCHSFVEAVLGTEDMEGAFDIVHAHDWLVANALVAIKEKRSRKSIFTMHSTEYGRCGNNFQDGASAQVRDTEWSGIYHADKVIAVSQTLRNELNWLYSLAEDKVQVVYNGVNCQNFDGWIDAMAVRKMYEIEPTDPMVFFAGRMVYQKGPDLLIETIPQILREHPHAKFVFGGDGDMRYGMESMACHKGVQHATRFLGHISGWRLKDLFKTADCVCVPSRNEPFGIVILEAWSAGKPVVASINGGPSEFVWHNMNGLKVEAAPQSIEWGVNTMLSDLEHAEWMGTNGRATVETVFSWDNIADETLAIYNS